MKPEDMDLEERCFMLAMTESHVPLEPEPFDRPSYNLGQDTRLLRRRYNMAKKRIQLVLNTSSVRGDSPRYEKTVTGNQMSINDDLRILKGLYGEFLHIKEQVPGYKEIRMIDQDLKDILVQAVADARKKGYEVEDINIEEIEAEKRYEPDADVPKPGEILHRFKYNFSGGSSGEVLVKEPTIEAIASAMIRSRQASSRSSQVGGATHLPPDDQASLARTLRKMGAISLKPYVHQISEMTRGPDFMELPEYLDNRI